MREYRLTLLKNLMQKFLILNFILVFSLFAAPPAAKPSSTLELIRQIPHTGYSEGIDYHNGYLWHALPKELKKIDPKDGTVLGTFKPATPYSESLTWFQDRLWNLSYDDNGLYAGKLEGKQFIFKKEFSLPESHGWGIEHRGKEIVFTGNYSNKLYFYDPAKKIITRTLATEGAALEDLAWDGTYFWSSSFTQDRGQIFAIHPETGKIMGKFALPESTACNIIDGTAYDGKNLWVTGKECASIYYFKIPKITPERAITNKNSK